MVLYRYDYYYYYYYFIPQVVKIPGLKTTKAKIKMSDGQRSGVNWQSVAQKHGVEAL